MFRYTFIGWVWGGPAAPLYQVYARDTPPPRDKVYFPCEPLRSYFGEPQKQKWILFLKYLFSPENPTDSNRPEEGREVIDDNYPHTDASEESRELDEYLTKIQERAHDGPISDIQGDGQDNRIINIQEGGQDDPMFDFERLQEPEKQNIGDTNRVDKDETISEERQEHLSRTTADDISDSEQNKKVK